MIFIVNQVKIDMKKWKVYSAHFILHGSSAKHGNKPYPKYDKRRPNYEKKKVDINSQHYRPKNSLFKRNHKYCKKHEHKKAKCFEFKKQIKKKTQGLRNKRKTSDRKLIVNFENRDNAIRAHRSNRIKFIWSLYFRVKRHYLCNFCEMELDFNYYFKLVNRVMIWKLEKLLCSINIVFGNERGRIDVMFSILWHRHLSYIFKEKVNVTFRLYLWRKNKVIDKRRNSSWHALRYCDTHVN